MVSTSQTEIKAAVELTPGGSQVFLAIVAFIAAACLATGFFFLWHKPLLSVPPTVIGCAALYWACRGWLKAQHNADSAGAIPTTIVDRSRGVELQTDSRALSSAEAMKGLGNLFQAIGFREPLPEPDGLVNANGTPIPNSKNEAAARVARANGEAEQIIREVASAFCSKSSGQAQSLTEQQVSALDKGWKEASSSGRGELP